MSNIEDRYVVHDRNGVQGEYVPINENTVADVPEEYNKDLEEIEKNSEELYSARMELGRLMQIMYSPELKESLTELGRLVQITHHLVNVCNTAEGNLARAKENIIIGMGLEDGNWAIDFSKNPPQVGKVLTEQKKMPRTV